MTLEEYKAKMSELESTFSARKKKLMREFAISNNQVKVGDIIEERSTKMLVKSISVYLKPSCPCCIYHGEELKKNGEPRKIKKERSFYQPSVTNHYPKEK